MPEQPPLPPVQPSENRTLPSAELQVETFDFDALEEHFIGKKKQGRLTTLEEVELGYMIQAGEQAKGVLAAAEAMYVSLDPGEREQCQADIKTADRALDIFARANESIVISIAQAVKQRYSGLHRLEIEDIQQQTRLFLYKDIQKFDPKWGVRFTGFVHQYLYPKVLEWAQGNSRLIRLSDSANEPKATPRISDAISIEVLDPTAPDDTPYDELIADRLLDGLAAAAVKEWIMKYGRTRIGQDASDIAREEAIVTAYNQGKSPELLAKEWQVPQRKVNQIIRDAQDPVKQEARRQKSERMYKLLLGRYGYGKSCTTLGPEWGITRERALQIIHATLLLIRTQLSGDVAEQIAAAGFALDPPEQPNTMHPDMLQTTTKYPPQL